jgi:hypothetical protein
VTSDERRAPTSFSIDYLPLAISGSKLKSSLETTVEIIGRGRVATLDVIMDLSMKMLRDVPSVIHHHWKEGTINRPMAIWVTLVHISAVVGLMSIPQCSRETLMWAFILWPIR